jgi:hypothetical protein
MLCDSELQLPVTHTITMESSRCCAPQQTVLSQLTELVNSLLQHRLCEMILPIWANASVLNSSQARPG